MALGFDFYTPTKIVFGNYEIGGMFDVAHGAGLAAVWGSWARYVWKDSPERFVNFAIRVHGVGPGAGND